MNHANPFAVDALPATAVADFTKLWQRASTLLQNVSLYALIDAAFDETACADYRSCHARGDYISLYECTPFEELAGVSPWVFRLPHADPVALETELGVLCALRGTRPMLSFIATTMDTGRLHKHFRPFLQVSSDDNMPLFLRFADTRIIDPLFDVLTREQRTAFIPPDMGIWFPRRKAGAVGGIMPDKTREPVPALRECKLTAVQFNALVDQSDADSIIRSMWTTSPSCFSTWAPSDVHVFIGQQIERAQAHGLSDLPSLQQYCITAWELGPDFDLQPEFAYAIQRATRERGGLATLIQQVPDASWEAAAQANVLGRLAP